MGTVVACAYPEDRAALLEELCENYWIAVVTALLSYSTRDELDALYGRVLFEAQRRDAAADSTVVVGGEK